MSLRTEDLVAHVVLPDEVSEKLLVDAGLVDDLIQKTSVSYLRECFQQGVHTAVSQKVQPSSSALSNTGSACSRVRLFPRPKLMPIAPKPGTGTWMSPNC